MQNVLEMAVLGDSVSEETHLFTQRAVKCELANDNHNACERLWSITLHSHTDKELTIQSLS